MCKDKHIGQPSMQEGGEAEIDGGRERERERKEKRVGKGERERES